METPLNNPNPVLSTFTQLLNDALTENIEAARPFYRLSVDDMEHTLREMRKLGREAGLEDPQPLEPEGKTPSHQSLT